MQMKNYKVTDVVNHLDKIASYKNQEVSDIDISALDNIYL